MRWTFTRQYKCKRVIIECINNLNEKHSDSTTKIFNTVHSLAKKSYHSSDIGDGIEFQIKNGVDMSIRLYSRKTALKIINYIARQIKKELFTKIIKQSLIICVTIDEASTVSNKLIIVIFLKR